MCGARLRAGRVGVAQQRCPLRQRDHLETRLAAASACQLVLVLVGSAVVLPSINDVTSLALAAILLVFTLPVGAKLISSAAYHAAGTPRRIDTVDERRARPE